MKSSILNQIHRFTVDLLAISYSKFEDNNYYKAWAKISDERLLKALKFYQFHRLSIITSCDLLFATIRCKRVDQQRCFVHDLKSCLCAVSGSKCRLPTVCLEIASELQ